MKKENKKYLIIALVLIAIITAIVFIVRYYELKKQLHTPTFNNVATGTGGTTASGGSGSGVAITVPYIGNDSSKWKAGDVIKALGTVNVYGAAGEISTSNIVKTFVAGDTIGKFKFYSGGKAYVDYLNTNALGWSSLGNGFLAPTANATN